MMQLEEPEPDVFLARGPQYPWGGLYGGQIVAQALRAGAATVEERFHVHSLHAYFIRPGNADEPIRFEVTRSRDGRSFCTRHVVASQQVGVILTMSLSFQVDEAGHDVQTARLPDLPPPEGLENTSWSPLFDRRFPGGTAQEGRGIAWLRLVEPLGDDRVLNACALAYLSDDIPTDAVVAVHPDRPGPGEGDAYDHGFWSASLDHAIWFHRPFRMDEWLLYVIDSPSASGARGLSRGQFFTQDGRLVASVAQEGLIRKHG